MIVDGKKIAERITESLKEEVAAFKEKPKLAVITCAPNFETRRFLDIKKRKADEVGIALSFTELPETVTEEESVRTIEAAARASDGIVVQLPFPEHITTTALISAIPASHDVDAFNVQTAGVLPPVVGAMQEILKQHHIAVAGKRAVIVGSGRLVGTPAAVWLRGEGAHVDIVTKADHDIASRTREADILVLGAGKVGLMRPDMIKDGVVLFDAGTSEEGGELRGDAEPQCAEKASLFTPVPGGIGPITIAILLRNLVILASRNRLGVV